MKLKNFKEWSRQDIADEFGLSVKRNCRELADWLDCESESITKEEKVMLEKLKTKLTDYVDIWNEQELIIKFISFIIGLIDYDTDRYKSFANRRLSSIIEGKEVGGEVDLMVASGEFEPKAPYFCLHEYKKERGIDNDPLGQLLIAMLAAKELNGDGKPVYGAYVFGRNWFFLTLTGKEYCISNEFVATRDDIYDIFKIMKKLKEIVEERESQQKGEIASDD